jgi:hypothetical protein
MLSAEGPARAFLSVCAGADLVPIEGGVRQLSDGTERFALAAASLLAGGSARGLELVSTPMVIAAARLAPLASALSRTVAGAGRGAYEGTRAGLAGLAATTHACADRALSATRQGGARMHASAALLGDAISSRARALGRHAYRPVAALIVRPARTTHEAAEHVLRHSRTRLDMIRAGAKRVGGRGARAQSSHAQPPAEGRDEAAAEAGAPESKPPRRALLATRARHLLDSDWALAWASLGACAAAAVGFELLRRQARREAARAMRAAEAEIEVLRGALQHASAAQHGQAAHALECATESAADVDKEPSSPTTTPLPADARAPIPSAAPCTPLADPRPVLSSPFSELDRERCSRAMAEAATASLEEELLELRALLEDDAQQLASMLDRSQAAAAERVPRTPVAASPSASAYVPFGEEVARSSVGGAPRESGARDLGSMFASNAARRSGRAAADGSSTVSTPSSLRPAAAKAPAYDDALSAVSSDGVSADLGSTPIGARRVELSRTEPTEAPTEPSCTPLHSPVQPMPHSRRSAALPLRPAAPADSALEGAAAPGDVGCERSCAESDEGNERHNLRLSEVCSQLDALGLMPSPLTLSRNLAGTPSAAAAPQAGDRARDGDNDGGDETCASPCRSGASALAAAADSAQALTTPIDAQSNPPWQTRAPASRVDEPAALEPDLRARDDACRSLSTPWQAVADSSPQTAAVRVGRSLAFTPADEPAQTPRPTKAVAKQLSVRAQPRRASRR